MQIIHPLSAPSRGLDALRTRSVSPHRGRPCHLPQMADCSCRKFSAPPATLLSGSVARAASRSTVMCSSAADSDWSIQSMPLVRWQAFLVTRTRWLTDSSRAVVLQGNRDAVTSLGDNNTRALYHSAWAGGLAAAPSPGWDGTCQKGALSTSSFINLSAGVSVAEWIA